jgi:hypothetical protein
VKHTRNERDITINVIQNNTVNNRRLAQYFAEKYREEMKKMQSQKT